MSAFGLRLNRPLRLSPKRRGSLQPPGFSPDGISDLAFWFDAARSPATLAAGAVERLDDLSAEKRHAVQMDAAHRPVLALDPHGRQVLAFDGDNDWLSLQNPPALASGLTLFVVFRIRERTDFAGIVSAGGLEGTDHASGFAFSTGLSSDSTVMVSAFSAEADPFEVLRAESTEVQYAIVTLAGGAGTVRDVSGEVSETCQATVLAQPLVVALGARLNDAAPFAFGAIDLYEVGLFARPLDPTELDQLEGYLRGRRGLHWSPLQFGADLAWLHDAGRSAMDLTGSEIDTWCDLGTAGRHLTQSGTARPDRSVDHQDRAVVRFDGVDDLLSMTGPLPALEPFSVALIFRVRERSDFAGVFSAGPSSGVDHETFLSFQLTDADGVDLQLLGRSAEADPLHLATSQTETIQIAIWTTDSGQAELRDQLGATTDTYGGSLGVPAEIVIGGRFDGSPFGFAAIDVYATLGISRALSAADQQRIVGWAQANWGL